MLELPSRENIYTWEESQDELTRYQFLYAHDESQVDTTRTNEPNWFSIHELKFVVKPQPPNKTPGHTGIGLEIVRQVLKYHTQWLLAI